MKSSILVRALPFAALAATAGFATTAQAVPVIEWGYTVTSAFTSATFSSGGGTTTTGATEISWGATGGSTVGCTNTSNCRSAIGIVDTPTAGPPNLFTDGSFEEADDYYHINNIISSSFQALDTATLSITIDLVAVDPAGGDADPALSRTFDIAFTETANRNVGQACADGGADGLVGDVGSINEFGCADIFVLEFDFGQFDFIYDGEGYSLFLFEDPASAGFPALGFLSAGDCAAAGVAAGCFGFKTKETVTTIAEFVIAIESRDIPEPAMLGLFGLGLIGLGAARRRKA